MSKDEGKYVSFETTREHYGIWRWRVERDSSNRLVKAWAGIGESSLSDQAKARLANLAWATATFERAYDVLVEDILRAERAKRDGVPPVMALLSGPYQGSLEYLMGMGMWMDLGDVFVAYRTIRDRLYRCKRLGGQIWSEHDIEDQAKTLSDRTLPGLNPKPVVDLADTILHDTWDPSAAMTLPFTIVWNGTDQETLDFAEDDVRKALQTLVEETLQQIYGFIDSVLART